jgi:carbonic anhydrase
MNINNLIENNIKFQQKIVPTIKNDLLDLAQNGQKPQILFITCSDSRINPDLIFNTKPGDIFVVRNIGNFVAKYGEEYSECACAIEYALEVLDIKHIIVCGHSKCGACATIHQSIDNPKLKNIQKWLKLTKDIKKDALEVNKNNGKDLYQTTEKISIIHQLKNLETFPNVKSRLENNKLKIDGWYYDIQNGNIEAYDKIKNDFTKLT